MMLKRWWIYYTHNNQPSQCMVQAMDEEQAIHNGKRLAEYYFTNEQITVTKSERA